LTPYVLPTLLTLAYIALQASIERRNYLLAQGGYGLGPQIVLNPLRSLALIVAPLPGSEHADAAWLAPAGALVALLLLALFARGPWGARRLILALGLTLLPTAPFASPPDSRYLYLPVMAAALLLALGLAQRATTNDQGRIAAVWHWSLVVGQWSVVILLASAAAGELHAREGRFAAASGPGGSLWRVASAACAEAHPERMLVVDPPLAAPHVEAIVSLSCGSDVRVKIVGRDQIEGAIKARSLVIGFANGSAEVERRT
jgi:hypothetical protein